MTLGEKIQALRTAAELSQENLAEQLGVSRQAVSKWELDKTVPDVKYILALSDLFHVTTDDLLKAIPSAPLETPLPSIPPSSAASTPSETPGRVRAVCLLLRCGNTLFFTLLLFYLGKVCLWRESGGKSLVFILITMPLLIALCQGLLWKTRLSSTALRCYRRGVASAVVLMGFALIMPFGFAEVIDDLLISQVEGRTSLPTFLVILSVLLWILWIVGSLIAHLLLRSLRSE